MYRILFIDISQFFTQDSDIELNAVEPPLGCMSILTYLNHLYKDKIYGEIIKTGVDVDSFAELEEYIKMFRPNIIATRTMTYFKNFYFESIKRIKTINQVQDIPIIAGGPHPTIDPVDCLSHAQIDACVIGEGEIIVANLIGKILDNGGKFPTIEQLKQIKGLAFRAD